MDQTGIIAIAVFAGLVALWLIFYFIPVGLWFSALVSGVRISLLQLILMRWRKVPPSVIVSSMIESTKAGLSLDPNELEAHFLAGGNVPNVVHALVSAQKANIQLDFKMATAIDPGRDVFEAVQMSVNPKVINTPPVAAVAKDGIQLIAKARVTVRANIKQLVGGAGEETVLARVGEGIVSSIGSAVSHKVVLENPDSISRVVLDKGLDAGTAFEILSIDIADIDVGKNIGAQLQMDQAQADKNIAQAKAEERRAMAVALEQENRAKAQDARAKVILAEAEVPLAMARRSATAIWGSWVYKMKTSWPIRPCAKRSRSPSIKIGDPFAAGIATCRLRNLHTRSKRISGNRPAIMWTRRWRSCRPMSGSGSRYAARTGRFGRRSRMGRDETSGGRRTSVPHAEGVAAGGRERGLLFRPVQRFPSWRATNEMRSMSATVAGSMRARGGAGFLTE